MHGLPAGWHCTPGWQATHSPALQTCPSPHHAPFGAGAPVSSHLAPALHVWMPWWHGAPEGWQEDPGEQYAHWPAVHT
jgi:hypothetical protein